MELQETKNQELINKIEVGLDLFRHGILQFLQDCMFQACFMANERDVKNGTFKHFSNQAIKASSKYLQHLEVKGENNAVKETLVLKDDMKFTDSSFESKVSYGMERFNEQFPFFIKKCMLDAKFEQEMTEDSNCEYLGFVTKVIEISIEEFGLLETAFEPKEVVECIENRFAISPNACLSFELIEQTSKYYIYCVILKENTKRVLKVMKRSINIQNLNNELEASRKICHPAFRKAYQKTQFDNRQAMLLEWVEGESLETIPKLDLKEFLFVAREIVSVLVSMHTQKMMHMNLTCEHVIYNASNRSIKVIGSSYSCVFSQYKENLTSAKLFDKDLRYISPEQTGRNNRITDFRCDFYCLGIMFYRLLTGQYPFDSNNALKLIHMHILASSVKVCEVNKEIPSPLSDMVSKLMNKNAEDRYQSAKGIIHDLDLMISEYDLDKDLKRVTLAKHDFCETLLLPQVVYGRKSEYETMMSALGRVCNGAFEVLFVTGKSGTGKSMLVMEIDKSLIEQNGFLVLGKFDCSKASPYSAILEAIRCLCDLILLEDSVVIANYRYKMQEAFGEEGRILTDAITNLDNIVGKQPYVANVNVGNAKNRFNYVFTKFMRAICSIGRPLVFILEDLQWADADSLYLLKELLTDTFLSNMMFVGAYQSNGDEFNVSKNLDFFSLNKLVQIQLNNFDHDVINDIVSDTLKANTMETYSLSALILEKTKGNPFFVKQFLTSLCEQGIIFFCYQERKWKWQESILKQTEFGDTILDLLVKKIRKLDSRIQYVLKVASCLGGHAFSLNILKLIVSDSTAVEETLSTGMIIQAKGGNGTTYDFAHDQIQQAAFSLLPPQKINDIFLYISTKLRKLLQKSDLEEHVFVIANLLLQTPLEKIKDKFTVAALFLLAGTKAAAAVAFKQAYKYFEFGFRLISSLNCWKTTLQF